MLSMGALSPGLSTQDSFWLMSPLPILCVIIWVSLAELWSPGKNPWWRMTNVGTLLKYMPLPRHPEGHSCSLSHAPSLWQNMLSASSYLSPYPCPACGDPPPPVGLSYCACCYHCFCLLSLCLFPPLGSAQAGAASQQGPTLPWGLTCAFCSHLKGFLTVWGCTDLHRHQMLSGHLGRHCPAVE